MDAKQLDDLLTWVSSSTHDSGELQLLKELALLAREAVEKRQWYMCSERMPPVGLPVLTFTKERNYIEECHYIIDAIDDDNAWESYDEPTCWCFVPGPAPVEEG